MQARLFHLHALSALHCGVGQSEGVGVVDLPIARARATKLPVVPGSSLRGVLRQRVAETAPDDAKTLFGPRTVAGDGDSFAGALSIGDAHLLALPVRCLAGIVGYATAPFILRRYARDLERAGVAAPEAPGAPGADEAFVTSETVNCIDGKLVLEDMDLTAQESPAADEWAGHIAGAAYPGDTGSQKDFIQRFAVLPDAVMDFLAETATEVRARIALDPDTGAVRKGALWYEESLPAETVLWGVYALSNSGKPGDTRSEKELAGMMPGPDTLLQIGGKAGVGHGLARFLVAEAAQ